MPDNLDWRKYLEQRLPGTHTVAILGFGADRHAVPWDDPKVELWGLNNLHDCFPDAATLRVGVQTRHPRATTAQQEQILAAALAHMRLVDQPDGRRSIFRYTRFFQFHDNREHLATVWSEIHGHLQWCQAVREFPIYMQRRREDIPCSVRFPKERIEALTPHGSYFASSFAWMVAFAILLECEEIQLHGCGSFTGEPLSARPCLEYWCGVAEGRGIPVKVLGHQYGDTDRNELFKIYQLVRSERQYGYELSRLVLEGIGPDDKEALK